MKVFYYQMEGGNVGDDLNASLWQHLIPNLADRQHPEWLIGIGTILNRRIDQLQGSKVVMGSGYRPGVNWKPPSDLVFAAVRGNGTVEALGLDKSVVRCDPGFLINVLYSASPHGSASDIENSSQNSHVSSTGSGPVALVPHVASNLWSDVSQDGRDAGFDVISPTLEIGEFIRRLKQCSRVLCESMHAAIFADALRIPWARVQICSHYYESPCVSHFKWRDAFSILGVPTNSINKFAIVPASPSRPRLSRYLRPLRRASERRLVRELQSKSQDSSLFKLSDSARLQESTSALLQAIETFARD